MLIDQSRYCCGQFYYFQFGFAVLLIGVYSGRFSRFQHFSIKGLFWKNMAVLAELMVQSIFSRYISIFEILEEGGKRYKFKYPSA
jgi:hypothetical protein